MNREVHVRFCGNIGVKLPCVTRLAFIVTDTAVRANQQTKQKLSKPDNSTMGQTKITVEATISADTNKV
jgi:hypothetical protein